VLPRATTGSRFAGVPPEVSLWWRWAPAPRIRPRRAPDWRRSHPGVDHSLIRTVNWPGITASRVEADAHGFRTVLKFPGDDSDMGTVVQVAPASAGPRKMVPYLVTDRVATTPRPARTKTAPRGGPTKASARRIRGAEGLVRHLPSGRCRVSGEVGDQARR
jgi:hypothetical protein